MEKKVTCYLCSLESNFFPSKGVLHGISCKRCGDYYMDDFLIECGEPTKTEDKSILSGYTKWEKELKHPIPEIKNENYEKIIRDNKDYSDTEKVDKLLLYYSENQPKRGSLIPYDSEIDYPITFSNDGQEFFYLLNDLANKNLGFVRVETRNSIRIMPEGWKRIEWFKKVELADEKYDIERDKIMKKISTIEMELIEQTNVKGSRYSSGLARKRKNLYLDGTIQKLEKKLEIDKRVISGLEIVSKPGDLNFLIGRIRKLVEFEKNFLTDKLKEVYQNCKTSQGIFDHDIAEVHKDVDSKMKEILVDLKIEGLKEEKVKIPILPERDINTLIEMDESTQLEFKSSFQWDIEQNCKNKNLRNEVIKTVGAFNNTEGGYLLIGINDEKEIVGLEKDYSSFRGKQNKDVFLQTLTHKIENKISKDFAAKVDVKFYNLESKDVCRIKVNFGIEHVWVKEDKDTEVFYIRLQNLTKALSPSESVKYIKKRWR
ncbi:hypothetical protein ES703_56068 [subsurface metagenome]